MTLAVLTVICTKDRPTDLRSCLDALATTPGLGDVLVVDASGDLASATVVADAKQAGLRIRRLPAVPGLAAQRNIGIEEARAAAADVLVFVDDDVVVEPLAIPALVRELEENPEVAATGAVVVDEPPVHLVGLKSFFRIWSRTPGCVLPSGRNVIGHHADGPWPRRVEWLATCAIALRLELVADERFDERLRGYSYGEDFDLTFRLSRRHPLSVAEGARVCHRLSSAERPDARALARRRIQLRHAWVLEHRHDGMRVGWFWWSVVGEVILLLAGAVRRRGSFAEAVGVIEGSVIVVRRGSHLSAT